MQQTRFDSARSRYLMLGCTIIAMAMISGLSGCAVQTIEDLESASIEADQEKHFRGLVQQFHRTVGVMQIIFGPLGVAERSGLSLDTVTLSMDISHAQDEDGNLAALITAGDDESQSVEDKVVMTIKPGRVAEAGSDLPALAERYRDYEPCRLPPASNGADTNGDRLDVMLVQASMTALDAWLCAADDADSTDQVAVALQALTITLTIDASRNDSGGLELTLGTLSVGEELDVTIDRVATVEFSFSQPADP